MSDPTPGQFDREPPANTDYFLENWKQVSEEIGRPEDGPWVDPTPQLLPGVYAKLDFRLRKRIVVEINPETGEETYPQGENMWVQVVGQNDNGDFIGTLANDPSFIENIKFGDEVIFRAENVRQITPPNATEDTKITE